jgi:hypothetical protein
MKTLFAYRKFFLTTVIVLSLGAFFGCSSKDNVKYGVTSDTENTNTLKSIRNDSDQNRHQERYPDYY